MKKIAMAVALAFTLIPAASFAQLAIRIGPPPPVYEQRGPRPDRDSVWQRGHQHYDNDHYVWTPGRYEDRPRRGAVWVAPRTVRQHGQWIEIEGHWR